MADLYTASQKVVAVGLERQCFAIHNMPIGCNGDLSRTPHALEIRTKEEVRDPELAKVQLKEMIRGYCAREKSYLREKFVSCESDGEIQLVKRTQTKSEIVGEKIAAASAVIKNWLMRLI